MVDKSLLFVRQLIFFSGNCFKPGGELFPTPTGYIRFRKKFRSTGLCGRCPFLHTIISCAVSAISESVSSGNSRFPCQFMISLSVLLFHLAQPCFMSFGRMVQSEIAPFGRAAVQIFYLPTSRHASGIQETNLSSFAPSNFTNSTKMLFLKKFFHFSLQHSENMVKW